MAQTKAVPEVGGEAPEFHLPSAQGGQLRLSMRTARGPVVVVFYEGPTEDEVDYFRGLAAREDEINMAAASVVGIGVSEPGAAREFVEKTGIKSYVLYDYAGVAAREWGLLEKSRKQGARSRPATFIVDGDRKVAHAWVGERPEAGEVLAKVSEITGLPKKPEDEPEEKPEKPGRKEPEGGDADAKTGEEKPKKMTAEEREKIKAERRAAREAGKTLKSGQQAAGSATSGREKPSPEEREKIKAERRAAREAESKGEGGDAAPEKKASPEEGGAVADSGVEAEEGTDAEAGGSAGKSAKEE